jgi:hypothetical protein
MRISEPLPLQFRPSALGLKVGALPAQVGDRVELPRGATAELDGNAERITHHRAP